MAEIDTSIFAHKERPPPFEVLRSLADTKKAVTDANSAAFDLAAKQKLSKAYQMSVDPKTGEFDPIKFGNIMADPAYSEAATSGVPGGIAASTALIERAGKKQEVLDKGFTDFGTFLNGYLVSGKLPTADEVGKALSDRVSTGMIDPALGRRINKDIPDDPALMRAFITKYGAPAAGPAGMTPVKGTPDAAGADTVEPVYGQTARSADPSVGITPSGDSVGHIPTSGAGKTAVSMPALSASGVKFGEDILAAGNLAVSKNLPALSQMDETSQKFEGGPLINAIVPIVAAFGQATGQDYSWVTNEQEFAKWAKQYAQAQAARGGATDLQTLYAAGANPNEEMMSGTISKMVHVLEGNEDANRAMADAYIAAGRPADANTWAAKEWFPHFDPRVYQLARMTPKERSETMEYLKKNKQWFGSNGVLAKAEYAHQMGWLHPVRGPE